MGQRGELEWNIGDCFRVAGASSGAGEFDGGFWVASIFGGTGECNRGVRSWFFRCGSEKSEVKGRDPYSIVGALRVEATARPMGPGFDAQNSFSPLSCLGSEADLCFGGRDDTTVVSRDKGVKRSNPNAEPGSPSHFDGVELS